MNAKTIIFIIVGAAFVFGILLALEFGRGFSTTPEKTLALPERNDTVPEMPFLYNYTTKIVYTTDTTTKKDDYIADCSARGGVFQTCGNTCAPSAQNCSAVCALTCESK